MAGIFTTYLTSITSTYTGIFDFLEDSNQAVFNKVVGTQPTPLLLEAVTKGVPVEEVCTLRDKLHDLPLFASYLCFVLLSPITISVHLI